jgi:hypothetical protein
MSRIAQNQLLWSGYPKGQNLLGSPLALPGPFLALPIGWLARWVGQLGWKLSPLAFPGPPGGIPAKVPGYPHLWIPSKTGIFCNFVLGFKHLKPCGFRRRERVFEAPARDLTTAAPREPHGPAHSYCVAGPMATLGRPTPERFAMSKLTTEQQVVLAFFDVHHAGAMRCQGRWAWAWADEIHSNPDLAIRFLKDWADAYRDGEMLRAWFAPQSGSRQ